VAETTTVGDAPFPPELFMDLDRSSPVPLYYQVAERIESAITSHALPAGSRIENEIALSERLGISRPTIRRAIQEVVDKGLLVRRRGIGTQVVQGQVTRGLELTSLFDDLIRGGQVPTTELLSREILPASAAVAEALAVPLGSDTLHLRRLRSADGVPVAVLDNVLPADYLDLDTAALQSYGLYQVLRSRGTTMRVARQRIGARRASADESELLELEDGAPVLTASRTVFDDSGRAVELGTHCYRPDLYSFDVTLVQK